MNIKPVFSLVLIPIIFSVLVLTVLRFLLYLAYPDYFSSLSLAEISESFWHGWRFDFSISAAAFILPLLLLLPSLWIPALFRFKTKILWLAFFIYCLCWTLAIGSVGYFGEVYRHIGKELLLISEDTGFLLSLVNSARLPWFIGGTSLFILSAWLWKKSIIEPNKRLLPLSIVTRLTTTVIAVGLVFIFNRGFILEGRALNLIDAHALGNEKQAVLAMNGAYSAIHNMRRSTKNVDIAYFTKDEFEQLSQSAVLPSFQRSIPSYYHSASDPRNVVIILLESWSTQYIDGLADSHYGATPFMDSLIEKSGVWLNTYAAGQRSIEGIQAILTSIPLLEGQQIIGWGLEQNRMTTLAKEANNLGYQSVLMQTSLRRSFHMDSIAGALGFIDYFSQEDFPLLRAYPEDIPQFGWDYEGLMFFADYLNTEQNKDRSVFSFFFTGTTHEPFPNPGSEFHVRAHDQNVVDNYLNTLRYSDWSLQQFMLKMSTHPKYQETVFIFVADHVLRASATSRTDSFHIPLIIFTPDGSIPASKNMDVASQYDILPTVVSLLGIQKPIATFGRSLLTEPQFPLTGALSKQGTTNIWFSQNEWGAFNTLTGQIHESSSESNSILQELNLNKVRLQQAHELLRHNRWLSQDVSSD